MKDRFVTLGRIYSEFAAFCQNRGRVSEADTRATLIDRLLHEVLDWPRASVAREVVVSPGYIDYVLSAPRPSIVLEAKASGESFFVPFVKTEKAARLKINGVLRSNSALQQALAQAQRYCSDRGIRYGVVSNGYSFVVFRAIVEGAPWRDGEAIVFHSPKVLESDFATLSGLLAYSSVSSGGLDDAFRLGGTSPRGHDRPISRVVNADSTYERNPINTALRPFVETYFGDIAAQDELDVLDHCYVHSRPLQIIDKDLAMIIEDRIPRFAATAVQVLTDETDQGGELERLLRAATSGPQAGLVALLMGGIGAGKTTFLKRFFLIVARDIVSPGGPAVLARLDFLGGPDTLAGLDTFMWRRLAQIFQQQDSALLKRPALEELCGARLDIIREAYSHSNEAQSRIDDAVFSVANDPERFAEGAIAYYIRRGRMPIVVFDNVDQLGVAVQTHIFTTAERFANHLGCLAILVMREESYCVAQLRRQLTAYTIRPYHLSSPGFRDLIKVRIEFATRRAAELRDSGPAGTATYREILDFFEILRRSIFHKNKNIVRLIESVSFGNMRLALDLFNNFIISGATNTPEMFRIFRSHGGYSVPFHQFAKSVILGDYRFYKESRSRILNAFDIGDARNASHFTTLRVLEFTLGNYARKTAEGFVDLQSLINAMIDDFDNEEDTFRTIGRLIEHDRQLLELDTRRCDSMEGATSIRVTTAGQYYLRFLVQSFAYLDLVWHDTPLDSSGLADSLARIIAETDMRTRFLRVEMFLDYLNEEEQEELRDRALPQTGHFFYGPFMPGIRRQYEREKSFIVKALKGAIG
jgi:hypothetical protein